MSNFQPLHYFDTFGCITFTYAAGLSTYTVTSKKMVDSKNPMKLTRPSVPMERHKNKEYINAFIVVAALVATVTFPVLQYQVAIKHSQRKVYLCWKQKWFCFLRKLFTVIFVYAMLFVYGRVDILGYYKTTCFYKIACSL